MVDGRLILKLFPYLGGESIHIWVQKCTNDIPMSKWKDEEYVKNFIEQYWTVRLREGFWYAVGNPFLMPVIQETKYHEVLIAKLKYIEENLATKHGYMGYSTCRVCNYNSNGSVDYRYKDWVWPQGYRHYLELHNVHPSAQFDAFLRNEIIGD